MGGVHRGGAVHCGTAVRHWMGKFPTKFLTKFAHKILHEIPNEIPDKIPNISWGRAGKGGIYDGTS